MNISCIICSDVFGAGSEIYSTLCGHLFHHHCLTRWLERSKSCPQCRIRTTVQTIHRIFTNAASEQDSLAEGETFESRNLALQLRYDSIESDNMMKRREISNLKQKCKEEMAKHDALIVRHLETEEKARTQESVIRALKDQMKYYKNRYQEKQDLEQEVAQLKRRLETLDKLDKIVIARKCEVRDMVRNETDLENLALMVLILKKALGDVTEKKRGMEQLLRTLKEDLRDEKAKREEVAQEVLQLKLELESCKENKLNKKMPVNMNLSDNLNKSMIFKPTTALVATTNNVKYYEDNEVNKCLDEKKFKRKMLMGKESLNDDNENAALLNKKRKVFKGTGTIPISRCKKL